MRARSGPWIEREGHAAVGHPDRRRHAGEEAARASSRRAAPAPGGPRASTGRKASGRRTDRAGRSRPHATSETPFFRPAPASVRPLGWGLERAASCRVRRACAEVGRLPWGVGGPCGPGHRRVARDRPGDRAGARGRGARRWSRRRVATTPTPSRPRFARPAARAEAVAAGRDRSSGRSRPPSTAVIARHGRLDILVNNAGITRDQLMLRMKREDWDAVLATNLTAAFTLRAGGAASR